MSLTLWLRCGADGIRPGGDPAAHRLFMLLLLKAKHNPQLSFDVKTVNESRPPTEFKEAGLRKTPALQISEDSGISHEDDILEELQQYPPNTSNEEAEDATSDFFRQFAVYIKDTNKDPKALLGELQRIDEYLEECGTSFLAKEDISPLDCLVLPRLHSIRIAAKELKGLEIPTDLINLWKYLERGYSSEIFRTSCPCDQEIILHWGDRPGGILTSQKKAQLSRQTPMFTRDIPDR